MANKHRSITGSIGNDGVETELSQRPLSGTVKKLSTTAAPAAAEESEAAVEVPEDPAEYADWAMERTGRAWDRYQRLYCGLLAYAWCNCAFQTMVHVFATAAVARQTICYAEGCIVEILAKEDCTAHASHYEFTHPKLSVVGEFGLVCDKAGKVPLLGTAFFLGFMIGSYGFGGIADKRGRRFGYILATSIMQVGSFCAAVAPNCLLYAGARFITGIGVGGCGLCAFIWGTELLGSSARSLSVVLFNGGFAVGGVALSPLAYSVQEWRRLSIVLFIFGMPLLILVLWQHESPRWLAGPGGRPLDAHKVFNAMARFNNKPDIPPPKQPGASADSKGTRIGPESSSQGLADVLRMLCLDARLSRRFVVMCGTWFVLTIGYYGLAMSVSSLGGNLYVASAMGFGVEFIAYPLSVLMIETSFFGRRGSTACGLIFGGFCCTAGALLVEMAEKAKDGNEADAAPGMPLMILAFAGKGGVALSFGIVFMYGAELFPTDIRTQSVGLQSMCSRIAGMIAPMIGNLEKVSAGLPMFLFGLPCVAAGAALLTLPETRGKPMPDTLQDVEPPASLPCFPSSGHMEERKKIGSETVTGSSQAAPLCTD